MSIYFNNFALTIAFRWAQIAATSAGLKALCTFIAANGVEDVRKCCGGNGYLMSSGIAGTAQDYLWQVLSFVLTGFSLFLYIIHVCSSLLVYDRPLLKVTLSSCCCKPPVSS